MAFAMLMTASQSGPWARSLHASKTSVDRVLFAHNTAALLQCQQARGFRLEKSSSYLDPGCQRDVRPCPQVLRLRFAEQTRRRLSWNKHPFAEDTRHALKRMVNSYWHSHDACPEGWPVDAAEANRQQTSGDKDRLRPGRNIGHIGREATEHLASGNGREPKNFHFATVQERRGREASPIPSNFVHGTSYGSLEGSDFVIDPITNRKVAKSPAPNTCKDSVDIPVKTLEDHQVEIDVEIDVNSEDTPAVVSSLRRSDPVPRSNDYAQCHGSAGDEYKYRPDDKSKVLFTNNSPFQPKYDDLRKYRAVMHEDDADVCFRSELPDYEDLYKCKPIGNEDFVPPQESMRQYDDLSKYKPVKDEETIQLEDLKAPYNDLEKYESESRIAPNKALHPDLDKDCNLVVDEQSSSDADSRYVQIGIDEYKKYSWGKATCKQADSPSTYEVPKILLDFNKRLQTGSEISKVQSYHDVFIKQLRPEDTAQATARCLDSDPDADAMSSERIRKGQNTKDPIMHGPGMWNKPDVNSLPSSHERIEGLIKNYNTEDLSQYRPVHHNESHGSPSPLQAEQRVTEDVTNAEESARYKPVYWNEPHGKATPATDVRIAEGLSKNYDPDELAKYQPIYWNEPDGKPLPSEDERASGAITKNHNVEELAEYTNCVRNESPGQSPPAADERATKKLTKKLTKSSTDSDQDQSSSAFRWNEADGKPAPTAEELNKNQTELDKHGPIMYQEPDGQPVAEADGVEKSVEDIDGRQSHDSAKSLASSNKHSADESSSELRGKLGEGDHAGKIEQSNYRRMLDSQMDEHQTASDAIDREVSSAIESAKRKNPRSSTEENLATSLTGSHVRDFPKDSKQAWSKTTSCNNEGQTDNQTMDSRRLQRALDCRALNRKLQTALDRLSCKRTAKNGKMQTFADNDLYSKEPQGLETSFADECGGKPTLPPFVRHYGSPSASVEKASESVPKRGNCTAEPTLYKILAFDPTMQQMNIAETSSFTADNASPLTPADALLRLSHPIKFFPHFAPLESEGYEIVSGSGDVLVFRKVRPATTKQNEKFADETPSASKAAGPQTGEVLINPIDMTGRPNFSPVSANFASPTGYVNYANLPEKEASKLPPPPPRIKYNIDVQREEAVFSGPKTRKHNDNRGKKRVGKMILLGGVWVSCISYALGLISDYFATGGADGTGPQGL